MTPPPPKMTLSLIQFNKRFWSFERFPDTFLMDFFKGYQMNSSQNPWNINSGKAACSFWCLYSQVILTSVALWLATECDGVMSWEYDHGPGCFPTTIYITGGKLVVLDKKWTMAGIRHEWLDGIPQVMFNKLSQRTAGGQREMTCG